MEKDMTPQQLDQQSTVQIEAWLDINSAKLQEMDDEPALTRKWLRYGLEDNWFLVDTNGRVWGKSDDGKRYYPYHIECNGKFYGIRLSQKAAN